jgi:MoaA/NifB/PqqE/SkfB family radical SAM enzyme
LAIDAHVDMAVAFGRSLLSWYVDGTPRPFSATFAVTNRCNLRCSYCNTPFLDPTDLPLAKVELLFDRLARFGVKRLGLAGGEPMARKDIGDIVAMAKARRFYITMNTNLLLFEKHRPALKGVDLFFTSLDGDREHHEAARGRGSYDGVLEAVAGIVAEGRPVVAICVVTEHSIGQMDHLLDVARAGRFQVHFQPQCTDTAIVRGGLGREMTTPRLQRFWVELLARKRAGRPVASSVPYLETLAAWDDFTRSAVLDPSARCAASRGFLYVDPAGHAYPCAYTKGIAPPVDMLGDRWREAVGRETPCTRCSVGPYLEFNLLYQRPVRTGLSVAASYLTRPAKA